MKSKPNKEEYKKNVVKSLRLCEEDANLIKSKAAAYDMKETEFIRHAAIHYEEGLHPKEMVKIQGALNYAERILIESECPEEKMELFYRMCGGARWFC